MVRVCDFVNLLILNKPADIEANLAALKPIGIGVVRPLSLGASLFFTFDQGLNCLLERACRRGPQVTSYVLCIAYCWSSSYEKQFCQCLQKLAPRHLMVCCNTNERSNVVSIRLSSNLIVGIASCFQSSKPKTNPCFCCCFYAKHSTTTMTHANGVQCLCLLGREVGFVDAAIRPFIPSTLISLVELHIIDALHCTVRVVLTSVVNAHGYNYLDRIAVSKIVFCCCCCC